jgi:hypothetical protein
MSRLFGRRAESSGEWVVCEKRREKARKPTREPYLRTRVNVIIVIVGWLIILVGPFGIASPHSLIDAVLGWPTAARFYFSVLTRVVLGVLFILAAPRCRLPRLIYVLGAIILLIGIVLFFLGADRVDEILHWFAACSELCIRFIYLVGILFGALLIYAGSKRR